MTRKKTDQNANKGMYRQKQSTQKEKRYTMLYKWIEIRLSINYYGDHRLAFLLPLSIA